MVVLLGKVGRVGNFRFRGGLAKDQARTNEIKGPGSRDDDVSLEADVGK